MNKAYPTLLAVVVFFLFPGASCGGIEEWAEMTEDGNIKLVPPKVNADGLPLKLVEYIETTGFPKEFALPLLERVPEALIFVGQMPDIQCQKLTQDLAERSGSYALKEVCSLTIRCAKLWRKTIFNRLKNDTVFRSMVMATADKGAALTGRGKGGHSAKQLKAMIIHVYDMFVLLCEDSDSESETKNKDEL